MKDSLHCKRHLYSIQFCLSDIRFFFSFFVLSVCWDSAYFNSILMSVNRDSVLSVIYVQCLFSYPWFFVRMTKFAIPFYLPLFSMWLWQLFYWSTAESTTSHVDCQTNQHSPSPSPPPPTRALIDFKAICVSCLILLVLAYISLLQGQTLSLTLVCLIYVCRAQNQLCPLSCLP